MDERVSFATEAFLVGICSVKSAFYCFDAGAGVVEVEQQRGCGKKVLGNLNIKA